MQFGRCYNTYIKGTGDEKNRVRRHCMLPACFNVFSIAHKGTRSRIDERRKNDEKRFWMFFAIMLLSIAMAFPAMAFAQNGSESSYTVTYTDPSGSFTDQAYQVERCV